MKAILFIGVLIGLGYVAYTYYGAELGIEDEAMGIHSAPKVFQKKADEIEKKLKERVEKMEGDLGSGQVEGY